MLKKKTLLTFISSFCCMAVRVGSLCFSISFLSLKHFTYMQTDTQVRIISPATEPAIVAINQSGIPPFSESLGFELDW